MSLSYNFWCQFLDTTTPRILPRPPPSGTECRVGTKSKQWNRCKACEREEEISRIANTVRPSPLLPATIFLDIQENPSSIVAGHEQRFLRGGANGGCCRTQRCRKQKRSRKRPAEQRSGNGDAKHRPRPQDLLLTLPQGKSHRSHGQTWSTHRRSRVKQTRRSPAGHKNGNGGAKRWLKKLRAPLQPRRNPQRSKLLQASRRLVLTKLSRNLKT